MSTDDFLVVSTLLDEEMSLCLTDGCLIDTTKTKERKQIN